MTASTTIAAGYDGIGGDARSMETMALEFGDGREAIGALVIWTPTGVPTASADSDVSDSGPDDRDSTRQVAQVV